MSNLLLKNRTNVYRKDGAASIGGTDPSHVIGRLDAQWRLERYTFTLEEPLTKIDFSFSAYWLKSAGTYANFTHYQGTDLRSNGVRVYISTKSDMSDWSDFYPTKSHNRAGKLTFSSNANGDAYTILKGSLDLSTNPLQAGTYYVFFYTENLSTSWGAMYWTNSSNIAAENPSNSSTYISYTACTAPTAFSFSGNILTSGFTVAWSGAKPGNNNAITGYELKFDWSNGSKILPATQNSYSYSFSSNENLEGKNITIYIRTIGKQDSAKYSSWTHVSGIVNNLPTAPRVTPSYQGDGIFGGGTVSFTVTGSTDSDGDSITYLYKINNGQENKITGTSFSYNLTQDTTFSFRAQDSKGECSPSVTIQAKVYSLTFTPTVLSSCQRLFGGEEKKSVVRARFAFETTSGVKAKFVCGNITKEFTDTTGQSLTLDFISAFGGLPAGGSVDYTVNFVPISTGKEEIRKANGEQVSISYTGTLFPIPAVADCEVFDQFGKDENIYNDSNGRCFFKKIRIKMPPFDPLIKNYDATMSFGNTTTTSVSKIVADNATNWYFEATFPTVKNSEAKELKIILNHDNNIKYEINFGIYSRIIPFPFNNLQAQWSEIPVVYNNQKIKLICAGSDEVYKACGIKFEQDGPIGSAIIKFNGKEVTVTDIESVPGDGSVSYPDKNALYFEFNFFDETNLENLGINSSFYYGVKTFSAVLSLANVYGEDSRSNPINLEIDFNKAPEFSNPGLALINGGAIGEGFQYLEGMKLEFTCNIRAWSYSNNWKIQIRTTETGDILIEQPVILTNTIKGADNTNIKVSFTIPPISEATEWNLAIQLTAPNTSSSESLQPGYKFNTLPVVNNTIELLSINYNNGFFAIDSNYSNSNNESNPATTFYLRIEDAKIVIDNNIVEHFFSSDSAIVFIEVEEKFTNSNYTLTKIWQSNSLVAYNIVPTVSYRKNRVGINTKDLDDKSNIANNSVFYIARANNARYVTFKIQNEEGTIDRELTIDLYSGAINNAIMDGGSWDGTSGEVIPGGPSGEAPSGLAAIAYSGEIGDLIQTSKEVIIFAGGSAPIEEI